VVGRSACRPRSFRFLPSFLHERHPRLAKIVAREIIDKTQLLEEHPLLGRPLSGREEYRRIVLQVLNAAYVFQYRTMPNGS
jgi:hypothetical protein